MDFLSKDVRTSSSDLDPLKNNIIITAIIQTKIYTSVLCLNRITTHPFANFM